MRNVFYVKVKECIVQNTFWHILFLDSIDEDDAIQRPQPRDVCPADLSRVDSKLKDVEPSGKQAQLATA